MRVHDVKNYLFEIYDSYPRHIGRLSAFKAISKAIQRLKDGEYEGVRLSEEQAICGLKNRAIMFSQSSAGNRKNFTPHPATWFNRSSYLDNPKEWEDDQLSKTQRRLVNNRSTILAGLGVSEDAGVIGGDYGEGAGCSGGDSFVVRDFQNDQSTDSGSGFPRLPENGEVLPKARGHMGKG